MESISSQEFQEFRDTAIGFIESVYTFIAENKLVELKTFETLTDKEAIGKDYRESEVNK